MALDMTTALTINAKVNGQQQIQGLTKSFGQATTSANGLQRAFNGLKTAGSSVVGILGSIGAGAALQGFITAGIEAERSGRRIANLAGPLGETSQLMKFAEQAAKTYGISQVSATNAVADLYARLRPTGTSLQNIQSAFLGVNNAAAAMGLTASETDNVMLQLSQALGSGKLQGDEFRSVMEQLPSIGQAVASVLKVNVADLKSLSSEGKITSEVLLRALNELSTNTPPPPDAYKQFQAALADLSVTIGQKLLPTLKPLVEFANQALKAFSQLPAPLQKIVVAIGAIAGVFVLLAPAIGTIGAIVSAIVIFVGALTGSGGLLAALAAVFTGPVGWVALLVAAGVAIYAFRDKVGEALGAIGKFFTDQVKVFNDHLVKPIMDGAKAVVDGIQRAFKGLADALRGPFDAVGRFIKSVFNGYIGLVEKFINGAISGINKLIAGANRALSALKLPNIPTVSEVRLPRFATGGVVDKPTVALVGEGREREYIVPESKMGRAALNYLMGKRGDAVLRNEGGRTGRASASQGNTTIQLNTGPVLQQNGQRYVTIEDLERSLTSLAANLLGNSRSYAGRRYQGLAR